jgi:hypothetical protein
LLILSTEKLKDPARITKSSRRDPHGRRQWSWVRSILEALNESGESDDWDSKGYDSDHYDAAMRRIEAELAQQALEEWNAAAKQVFMTSKGDDAG